MNSFFPTQIERLQENSQGHGMKILWSDGDESLLPSKELRKNCPCASCLEQRGDTSHAKPLSGRASLLKVIDAEEKEETDLQEVWAVGNYAIGMRWADGHDTGIYTFKHLRELSAKLVQTE